MGGGLLQLSTKGIEDSYLQNNPNINFFKKVYMRYTNFTMSTINVPCSNFSILNGNLKSINKRLPYNEPSKFRVKIPRNGDLIDNIFLTFQLPDIKTEHENGFKYIDNLGTHIIKSASLYIEDTLIETITGEFIYNYFRLNNLEGKNNLFNSCINAEKFFHIHHTNQFDTNNKINKYYNTSPSIKSKKIIVPLLFWLTKNRGLSLPLIGLRYHQVFIDFELRPFRDLCLVSNKETITHTNSNNVSIDQERYRWVKPSADLNIENYFVNTFWELDPQLEINYIFLDNRERNQIVKYSQQYLIEQVTSFNILSVEGIKNFEFEIYHPIKEIIIVPKRDDAKHRNEYSNFSNHDYLGINYKDFQTFKQDRIYSEEDLKSLLEIWKYRQYNNIPSINIKNHKFYDSTIIDSLNIEIDNNNRLEYKSTKYFNLVQQYDHYRGGYVDDILIYSLSRSPSEIQPTGFLNMSEIDNLVLNVNFKQPSLYNENYKYDMTVYFVNYNILDIRNGMGGLVYANK
jgi:hypothetical protein